MGNVGQLAVDLLLHNLRCRRVGAFSHPSLHAVVGNLPDPEGGTHLMTAMEGTECGVVKEVGILRRVVAGRYVFCSCGVDLWRPGHFVMP